MTEIPRVALAGREAELLRQAVELAFACPQSETAFAVGAIIASAEGSVLATGYSRELGDHWHAEEVALKKLTEAGLSAKGATLYCSLEPCGARVSRPTPCAEHIRNAEIARVVFCLEEPVLFQTPKGGAWLQANGIAVEQDRSLAPRVRAANAHLNFEI